MENALDYSNIISSCRTVFERNEIQEGIDLLLNASFQDQNFLVSEILGSNVSDKVKTLLEKGIEKNADVASKDNMRAFLTALKNKLSNLKILRLKLGFEARESSIDRFSSFVKENMGIDVILDISYEPTMIGGTIVEFEGVYMDYSLDKMIDKVFNDQIDQIKNIIGLSGR